MDVEAMIMTNDTSMDNESEVVDKIDGYMQMFICLLSLMSDLLIVTIMVKNRSMNTRTNKVIMHFAIADAFRMMNDLGLFYYIYEKVIYNLTSHRFYCVVAIFEITSVFASFLFVFLLLSNTLIKNTKFSDKSIISFYYGIIGLVLALEILFCAFFHLNFHVFYIFIYLTLATAFICLLIKDIYRGFKYWKKRVLSKNTTFRMNVARIYLYSCFVNFVSYGTLYIYLFGYVAGFFIVLYLAYSDHKFKMCLLNLLRFRNFEAEANIRFSDECSETMNERTDDNFTINGNTTSLP
ncbi:PREDICTED: uncharacterized protein LOC108569940 isoform X6 [Nicrophorus vespilloides]|uniref:Uncharacterized protein LOC108569940 isoform X6 n=1 Tax=Nicrophorus vespilloides TaxID=110193 RepID=A0ABM1NK49_NICVS|nr:PREDICTED: uncharacterized protein LOC108569940 isoform X6 [Nicrophorus vespilloides]